MGRRHMRCRHTSSVFVMVSFRTFERSNAFAVGANCRTLLSCIVNFRTFELSNVRTLLLFVHQRFCFQFGGILMDPIHGGVPGLRYSEASLTSGTASRSVPGSARGSAGGTGGGSGRG